MSGLAPLSYTTIVHWSQLTGAAPDPEDVQALITLDAVMSHPGDLKVGKA